MKVKELKLYNQQRETIDESRRRKLKERDSQKKNMGRGRKSWVILCAAEYPSQVFLKLTKNFLETHILTTSMEGKPFFGH